MNYVEDHSTDKYYDFNKLQSGKSEALESNDSNLVNSLNLIVQLDE